MWVRGERWETTGEGGGGPPPPHTPIYYYYVPSLLLFYFARQLSSLPSTSLKGLGGGPHRPTHTHLSTSSFYTFSFAFSRQLSSFPFSPHRSHTPQLQLYLLLLSSFPIFPSEANMGRTRRRTATTHMHCTCYS